MLSGIRSTKLVSSRLKAVVCELAMLPEMFSSAKDCARMPVTAVVRAPKIPITRLHLRLAADARRACGRNIRRLRCKPRATMKYRVYFNSYDGERGERGRAGCAAARQEFAGLVAGASGRAGRRAGVNVSATPFMQ